MIWSISRSFFHPSFFSQVTEPYLLVGMDVVGELKITHGGNQHICVMFDYFTKWAKAYAPNNKIQSFATRYSNDALTIHNTVCSYCWAVLFHLCPADDVKVNSGW